MTQKPKPDWEKLLAPKRWIATAPHWKMTPAERQAKIDEKRKKESEAAIKHKQLTAIYIDRIDDAFRDAKFKNRADISDFYFENRLNVGAICRDFVSFYNSVDAYNDAVLVWRFVERYFQERIELKYKHVRGL